MARVEVGVVVDTLAAGRQVYRMQFHGVLRGSRPHPKHGQYTFGGRQVIGQDEDGNDLLMDVWMRQSSDENIALEVEASFGPGTACRKRMAKDGTPAPDRVIAIVEWWRMTPEEVALLGSDRAYWRAMQRRAGVLGHDMPQARELHRELLRAKRQPILDQLDRDYSRAVGQKRPEIELDDIEARRQALRDLPADPRIEAAATLEELKLVELP